MEYYVYNDGELTHWGIKGMKWGIRRYQNKDGSLTAAGKKRRAAEESQLKEREKVIKRQEKEKARSDKIAAKKAELDAREKALRGETDSKTANKNVNKHEVNAQTPKVKPVSEMTLAELREHTERMNAERNYYEAQKNLVNSLPPKPVNKGKVYAEKLVKENILPAVGKATQNALENYMKKSLGLETKDELADLKKAFDILDTRQKIDKIKNPDKYLSWDDKKKKREYEDETAKREAAAKKKADDEAAERRKYEETNEPYTNPKGNDPSYSGYRSGSTTYSRSTTSPEAESYVTRLLDPPAKQGTVEGVGNSSKNHQSSSQSSSKSSVIDADSGGLMTINSNTVSRISTMTSSGKYTNAEIANKLGVSTSTVSKYSNGRDYVDKMMTFDENGKFIGYWSERMTVDGFI